MKHLKVLVRKCKGGKSLWQLSQEMWEWEVKACQSRPRVLYSGFLEG